MAGLRKPDNCPICNTDDLSREFHPERWVCINGHVAVSRPARNRTGLCDCGAVKADGIVPFKNGKNQCMPCYNAYMKEWAKNNVESLKASKAKYYAKNRTAHKDKVKANESSSYTKFMGSLYRRCQRLSQKKFRSGLRKVPLEFDLTIEFLVKLWEKQNGKCAITGVDLQHCVGMVDSASVDRIDSKGGYTQDNVQIVCKGFNMLKNCHTQADVQVLIKKVREVQLVSSIEESSNGI